MLNIDIWVSASKDSPKPSFRPTALFHCVIPDSPQYKTSGKLVSYNCQFVSVSGMLTDVTYKDPAAQNLEVKHFIVTMEEIVFLGQAAKLISMRQIPNTLDSKSCLSYSQFS